MRATKKNATQSLKHNIISQLMYVSQIYIFVGWLPTILGVVITPPSDRSLGSGVKMEGTIPKKVVHFLERDT